MIKHCSLFKFKEGTSPELIDEIVREFRALDGKIPVVKQMVVGRNIGYMADNYDIAANLLFETIDDYRTYAEDPTHWAFVRAYLLPNLDKRCAVQFDPGENERAPTSAPNPT